ncbi:UvrD-helicase domain-containing protein [Patescibacteria group bacterium]|jgi:DNA helicase-2/ATP-dependent DNA helicase PcrA|nr:UvrD-helicase domain-containing protein [Patescibacteria group bacterium]
MSDMGASFQAAYGRLNSAQKQAVDTIEGPVMVIAGPGTGKTQILTLRIANILKQTDTPPSGILALTFTEAGVFAMRKRLVELIGSRGYHVEIFTFHAFCNELIRRYPDAFPRIIGSNAMTDVDKIELIAEALRSLTLKRLTPFGNPLYYLKHIASAISDLKREHVSPERAHALAVEMRAAFDAIPDKVHEKGPHKGKMKGVHAEEQKRLEKNEELVLVYERYEELLRERALYDFDDMIVETVTALERDEEFLMRVQEEYLYLLADEHQDANNSQNRLLELLSSFHDAPNLFLVGDAKQAIYRFQGASLENFLYFNERFSEATLIQLTDNYRSSQGILDSSFSLIEKSQLGEHELTEPLSAQLSDHLAGQQESVSVAAFSEPELEYTWVARSLRDLIDQGVPPEECAILFRTNSDAEQITPALERVGVPFVVESDTNALADDTIRSFVALLRASCDLGRDELLTPVLFSRFLSLDPVDGYRVLRAARSDRTPLIEVLRSAERLGQAGVPGDSAIRSLGELLTRFHQVAHERGLLETLDLIAHESGFVGYLLSLPDARERLATYRSTLKSAQSVVEVNRSSQLADWVRHLDLMEEHGLSIARSRQSVRTPRVRLMTAHRAKGLEFDHVFLVRALDGHWGNRRAATHFSLIKGAEPDAASALDDERRLFYVALTRARHTVSITYPTQSVSGRAVLPTQFLTEIDPALVSLVDTEPFERTLDPAHLVAPRGERSVPVADRAYLRELFLEQGLSVTAYNTYLKDPWEYLFSSLLRVPQAPSKHLLFGNAVHGALRDVYERVREGESVDVPYALVRLRYHLSRAPLSEEAFDESLTKGEEALARYLAAHLSESPQVFATEFSVTGQLRIDDALTIPLRGILDRVDLAPSGGFSVVDYKTGAPKSRNHLLGKTKSPGAGDYYRQVTFYALLLEQYEGGAHPLERAEIAFIEPTDKGVLKPHEVFVPEREEVDALSADLARVAREIYDLAFWDRPCDPSTCSFCPLVAVIREARERAEGGA